MSLLVSSERSGLLSQQFKANLSQEVSPYWYWNCHIYGCAISWFLLGLYAFIVGINLRPFIPSKPLCQRACAFLCALSISRSIYLMIDPYETKHRLPLFITRGLFAIGLPCQTILFLYISMGLLRLTKINIRPYSLQSDMAITVIACCILPVGIINEVIHSIAFPQAILMFWFVQSALALFVAGVAIGYCYYGTAMLLSLREGKLGNGRNRFTNGTCCGGARSSLGEDYLDPNASQVCNIPRIRITDENDVSQSYKSESSQASGIDLQEVMSLKENVEDANIEDELGSNGDRSSVSSPTFPQPPQSHNRLQKKGSKGKNGKNKKGRCSGAGPNRVEKVRMMVGFHFFPAVTLLICVSWIYYETVGLTLILQPRSGNVWFAFVSLSRITELVNALSLVYQLKFGFNRL